MSTDRILQLKLLADVSDINTKMPQAASEVGKVEAAFGSLKNWGIAFGASLGADLLGSLTGELTEAVGAAGELRRELSNLGTLTGALDIDTSSAEAALSDLTQQGAGLGFGDPEQTAASFNAALAVTEDIGDAVALVQAGWDLARKTGEDAETSFRDAMDSIIGGGDEAEEKLGVFGETFDERMTAFNAKYGNFAEDFALTDEGEWETIEAEFDVHMTNLGGMVDSFILEAKRGITDGLEDWAYIFEEAGPILSEAAGKVFDGIVGAIGASLAGVRSLVIGALNAVIGAWNQLDFSLDFTVPNPAHGTVFDPVGTPNLLDVHTGDLIPDVGYIALAQGGIVTRPTLALMGEAGPEAVVPLDGRSMGNTYNITVSAAAASPADTGRAIVEAIEAYERRSGRGWRA